MSRLPAHFIVSIETECLTAVANNPEGLDVDDAIGSFLRHYARLAPSLAGTTGVFNGYGRVYCDCGHHVEIALSEVDSPYQVALLFEQVQSLATAASAAVAAEGWDFVLANNNYSGLLTAGCPTWGSHENYLADQHPSAFTEEILPFLVTRIYGGAGGVFCPTGEFLASVRSTCMATAVGGGTTEGRAIHSLARDEHHMGPAPQHFRYHLILGDGHRSQFNLALQLGATALAVKAAVHDVKLRREVSRLRRDFSADWLGSLRKVNLLAPPGGPLRVHPLVAKTQRLYLEAARRLAAELDHPPDWVPRLLADWEQTLAAYERLDRGWLSRRLDAFAKYEVFSAVLHEAGCDWRRLPQRPEMFHELALLDQSYHEFCRRSSAFAQLEQAGLLEHRVGPRIAPGAEPEPYVPEVRTRARPRAQFIRAHRDCADYVVDWAYIQDNRQHRLLRMHDPLELRLGDWTAVPAIDPRARRRPTDALFLEQVLQACDRGRFEEAHFFLWRMEAGLRITGLALNEEAMRYKAWVQARRGYTDGEQILQVIYGGRPLGLRAITDFCCVYRYAGLTPDLVRMEPLIRQGQAELAAAPAAGVDWELSAVFREHAAAALARHGHAEEARTLLEPVLIPPSSLQISFRAHARVLATLGETYRLLGRRSEASQVLTTARQLQMEHGLEGALGYGTLLSLAKNEIRPAHALRWLQQAAEIQTRNHDFVGHTATLLLEARLRGDRADPDQRRTAITENRGRLPALAQCPLLARILDHWDDWVTGQTPPDGGDHFWGL